MGYSAAWYVDMGRTARDFNGDGYADVVVGAPQNDAGGADAGRACQFLGGPGDGPDAEADAVFTGSSLERFGWSVATGVDVNGDGYDDLVVGAPENNAAGNQAGAAYIFLGGSASLNAPPADVTLLGETAEDGFGWSVY